MQRSISRSAHHLGGRKRPALWAATLVGALVVPTLASVGAQPVNVENAAFKKVWERADYPVAVEKANRSWLWGPKQIATRMEPLAESPGGQRQVQYYDKSRMEINDPNADPNSQWYVTNGLLVVEMITGKAQVGNNKYEQREPARIIVAGDSGIRMSPANFTPTYEALGKVATLAPGQNQAQDRNGQEVTETLSADATVGKQPPTMQPGFRFPRIKYYEKTTGHNIPDVFVDFMNQRGTVYVNGQFVEGQVMDWVYALGYPITEPYWIETYINNERKTIMMQAFQRRVLTYNPENPERWRVEMGNVGAHYYQWRYGSLPPTQPGGALPTRALVEPGGFSGIEKPLYTVANNQTEWNLLWEQHTANMERPSQPPAVDFKSEFVVAAFWGNKPDSCYRLDIETVTASQGTITVTVNQEVRQGGCATVITQPHEIVAVSKANLTPGKYSVTFVDKNGKPQGNAELGIP